MLIMTSDIPFSDLTIHHIRFLVEATTPILMEPYKGSALRGAWQSYISRAYCGAPPQVKTSTAHQNNCPVCYLTARDAGPESRRPFALRPPLSRQTRYEPDERFSFTFSLFGDTIFLLPYVILAVNEVGESWGLGRVLPDRRGRGRFRLVQVQAYDPHLEQKEILMEDVQRLVRTPTLAVTAQSIEQRFQILSAALHEDGSLLRLELLTPLRLIHHGRLMRRFDFAAFFQRLLERLFALGESLGREPEHYSRDALRDAVARYLPLAQKVEVIADETRWWDVKGYSSRLKKHHYLGGLVGQITLSAPDWEPLLPILLWGESVQLGKNIVKGGGWFEIRASGSQNDRDQRLES